MNALAGRAEAVPGAHCSPAGPAKPLPFLPRLWLCSSGPARGPPVEWRLAFTVTGQSTRPSPREMRIGIVVPERKASTQRVPASRRRTANGRVRAGQASCLLRFSDDREGERILMLPSFLWPRNRYFLPPWFCWFRPSRFHRRVICDCVCELVRSWGAPFASPPSSEHGEAVVHREQQQEARPDPPRPPRARQGATGRAAPCSSALMAPLTQRVGQCQSSPDAPAPTPTRSPLEEQGKFVGTAFGFTKRNGCWAVYCLRQDA